MGVFVSEQLSPTNRTSNLERHSVREADFSNPFFGRFRTKKHLAAILLAEDELSDDAIVAAVGVGRTTFYEWKRDPDFTAAVEMHQSTIIASALKLPIAKKHQRVKQLNDLNDRYHQVIRDRAERHAIELLDDGDTPSEAATGLLVKQMKIAANGKTVTEWVFDKALDSAIKETHKQAAQELGQWEEKQGISVEGGIRYQVTGIPDDALIGVIRPGGDE